MEKLIFVCCLLSITTLATAQVAGGNLVGCGAKYEYDAAGNHIKQTFSPRRVSPPMRLVCCIGGGLGGDGSERAL